VDEEADTAFDYFGVKRRVAFADDQGSLFGAVFFYLRNPGDAALRAGTTGGDCCFSAASGEKENGRRDTGGRA